jgi:hypothetical protein
MLEMIRDENLPIQKVIVASLQAVYSYGVRFTDMCPFGAISRKALRDLGMREMTYGWNLRINEIPVPQRRRERRRYSMHFWSPASRRPSPTMS